MVRDDNNGQGHNKRNGMTFQKAIITGANGFVGKYLVQHLQEQGIRVIATDIQDCNSSEADEYRQADITKADELSRLMADVQPDLIFHLAGFSSVSRSYENPELTYAINVGGTRNLLDAVRKHSPSARVILVSSAEVYAAKGTPIAETDPLVTESSPYTLSRLQQEALLSDFQDLDIVISRSFNHIGPGQVEVFVASSFARQIAEITVGKRDPVISVGNLEAIRDFTDVRDMVRAYLLLADKGLRGERYNLGSGQGRSIRELLDELIAASGQIIEVQIDQSRFRPSDNPYLVCDAAKFTALTGYSASIPLARTLSDMLEYWRNRS